jgi:hypothetical protein
MIFRNKAATALLLVTIYSFPLSPAHAVTCHQFKTPPTITSHRFQNFGQNSWPKSLPFAPLLCVALTLLAPHMETTYWVSEPTVPNIDPFPFAGNPNLKTPYARSKEVRKTAKRNRAKEFVEALPILTEEMTKSEKSIVELLTSGVESDHRVGKEALLILMKNELPWTVKRGRREFLGSKVRQFALAVQGKSEEEFFQEYDWFMNDIKRDRKFFKNGSSRAKRKSRPWRAGFSDKETYMMQFLNPEPSEPSKKSRAHRHSLAQRPSSWGPKAQGLSELHDPRGNLNTYGGESETDRQLERWEEKMDRQVYGSQDKRVYFEF